MVIITGRSELARFQILVTLFIFNIKFSLPLIEGRILSVLQISTKSFNFNTTTCIIKISRFV
jgi:hypothetical protein